MSSPEMANEPQDTQSPMETQSPVTASDQPIGNEADQAPNEQTPGVEAGPVASASPPNEQTPGVETAPVASESTTPVASRPAPAPRPPFVPREERDRRRREALASLVVGEWREGKVTGIAQFGAFVDLGGVDGLVHVSQLGTGGYVERVEDVVQVGQEVRVRVAEVDNERGRVSLSMREPRTSAPNRERPAAPPTSPRPPRPSATPGGFAPTWTPEPAPEARHDRRSRGGDRTGPGRGEDRSPRRSDRPRRNRDSDDEDWRSVRGDPRNYYSFGEEEVDEPAPTTPEELVARFGRRGNTR